jgi:hypothetical protein
VKRLRLLVLLALAACWLPATSHCAMEAAQLFEAACCEDGGAATGGDDCQGDLGCAWESAVTTQSWTPLLLKLPLLACLCLACGLFALSLRPTEASRTEILPEPPLWIPSWQFARRTALPVRAPALA